MKRRCFCKRFLTLGAVIGVSGCAAPVKLKGELEELHYDIKARKPQGVMPMGMLGTTGIRVSKFGFGSHMLKRHLTYTREREWMLREAYELGVTVFDVYDTEAGINQYEPTGRYLKDVIDKVLISVIFNPTEGRTVEQEMERILRLFHRDHIDLVRLHAWSKNPKRIIHLPHKWEWWETLFKLKEKGYIRAVGLPVHEKADLVEPFNELPLDFVIFPFNFYHNWTSTYQPVEDWEPVIMKFHKKGIGIITMKPFTGDYYITPLRTLARTFDPAGNINFAQACLKYIINSNLPIDMTFGGMFYPYHVYEDIAVYFNPAMSDEERQLLKKVRDKAKIMAKFFLPEHYRFLEEWAPDSWDDSDLFGKA